MLEDTFLTPSYLMIEENENFMLVSDSDYYWEVAGPAEFIEELFGKPSDAVNLDFMRATQAYRKGSSRIGPALGRILKEVTERSVSIT